MDENFFEVTVSQEGSDRIMRLFKLVRVLFAFSIVLSVLFLVLGYLRYIFYWNIPANGNFLIKFESIAFPIYTVALTVLMLCQLYSYFHFSRLCKKSILLRQTDLFNYSFKWLIRSALFSIVMVVIEMLMTLFSIYEISFLVSKMPAS